MSVIDVESDPFDVAPSSSDRMDVETPEMRHADGATECEAGPAARDDRLLFGLTTGDLVIVGVAVLFAVLFVPVTMFPSWTPRMALLLAVLPAGLVALGVLVARRSRSAMVAAGLLAWCLVAAFFTGDARASIIGMVGRELSLVVLAGSIGLWALARQLTDRGRNVLPFVLIAVLGLSLAVGVVQIVFDVRQGSLPIAGGRATGLTPHPVFFGALMAAGASLCASLLHRFRHPALGLFGVGAFAVGVGLSGSRVALIAMVVVIGWTMLRTSGAARWLLPIPVVVGTIIPRFMGTGSSSAGSSSADASSRLVGSAGFGERFQLWGYSLEAVGDRPLAGWGLGRFRPAVQGRFAPDFAPQDISGNAWFDAHNVLIASLVAVGVIGTILVVVFAGLAVRRVRGPLVVAAAAIAITWLLQPASLATLPLVMVLLGAAMPVAERDRAPRAPWSGVPRSVWQLAALLGVLLGGALMVGDVRLKAATSPPDAVALESASAWFLPDPAVADLVTQAWVFEIIAGGDHEADALRWAERATELEPDRTRWWNRLAGLQLAFGDLDGAKESLDTALALQPWDLESWELMGYYAAEVGDEELADEATTAICQVRPATCEP